MKKALCATALLLFMPILGCSTQFNQTATGTATGTVLGAGLGAIIGSASGHAGPGIAIGAAAGALGGALLGNSLDDQDKQNQARRDELARQQQQIEENQRLLDELRRQGADARLTDRGVVVNLPDILFPFNQARLTPSAQQTVGQIAGSISKVKHRSISVEGHTDSVGSPEYNKGLSNARARSVASELVRSGVPSENVSTYGYGEGAPIASNSSEVGRARNRRVEIVVEN